MTEVAYFKRSERQAIPADFEPSVCKWAVKNIRLPGSQLSEAFDPDITPWCKEPLDRCDDGETRVITFVKPVRAGGSVVGEVAACRWIARHNGNVIWYWEHDVKAIERWDKRIVKRLKACPPVAAKWPTQVNRHDAKKGLVIFPNGNLTVQGANTDSNVASDDARFLINEEVHAWDAGRLQQCYNRTGAAWNSVIVNISNAGVEGDQLHQAFVSGTQQHWEVKCPGCGEYHVMRTEFDKDNPQLGGLRYESDKCKLDGGDYDYNKLESTIRYQMPCGFEVRDERVARRGISLSGRYGSPRNTGAHLSNRSYSLEAVSVDYIPWLKLIQEKHEALRALRYGDPEPYKRYLQERECRFWNPEQRPVMGKIALNSTLKKNRDGLEGRFARFFALDRQQGSLRDGELPHWWLVIRDAMESGDSQLVWEGKCLTDEDAIGVVKEHGCIMRCGVADSGDDTTHVYQFCLRHGINAIKGSGEDFHRHKDGSRKIFSEEKPLHSMLNAPPTFQYKLQKIDGEVKLAPHPDEPLFWFYSRVGLLDRLAWLRGKDSIVKWETPGDVSSDYKSHMEAWELEMQQTGKSKQLVGVWKQVRKRDDLNKCEQYIAMLMEMAGLIGERIK